MTYLSDYSLFNGSLAGISQKKCLITTLNAHSFNTAQTDLKFKKALKNSDFLLPDGISIVWAKRLIYNENIKKIAGSDLFFFLMEKLQKNKGRCFFLGSTHNTLEKIQERASKEYPCVETGCYSPPFRSEFTEKDTVDMVSAVNEFKPDVLFIGLTAPKQEKWAFHNQHRLEANYICCIGAVFDFYAQNIKRAPNWMIQIGLEWLYRLIKEPVRMWQRYLIGNCHFIWSVAKEKIKYQRQNS